jgi:hypothetical protein
MAARPESLATALANLGDLDGDGRDDLLLGGPTGNPPYVSQGGFAELQFDSPFPSAVTGAATAIAPTSVTLGAAVVPAAQPTSVRVQYGPGTGLGNQTPALDAGSGAARTTLAFAVAGLSPSTAYSYRVVAANGSASVYGRVRTFTTAAPDGTGGSGDGGPGDGGPGDGGPGDGDPGHGGPGSGVDVTAPVARITRPARKKRVRRSAWRTLRGPVVDTQPSSGIKRVQVAATSRHGRRCRSLGRKGFAVARCNGRTRWLTAKLKGAHWQLRVKGLRRGTVRFRVRALDNAGNLQKPAYSVKIRLKR